MLPNMILSTIFMGIVAFCLGDNAIPYYLVIFLIGITFGGCYNICGTVIAVDISAQEEFRYNENN